MALLEVTDLEISLVSGRKLLKVVDGISFTVQQGETFGIVGESGCGKSLTALAIMGLLGGTPIRVTGGQILFEGQDLSLMTLDQRRAIMGSKMAMIFQEPMTSLNPVYTCGFQVMESLRLHLGMNKQEAKERTLQLFQRVELPRPEKMLKAYPHEISGGQKQRVMIAMAMSCKPGILIADEPTTALDVTVQANILDLMRQLQEEEEAAIMFISHDLGVIAELADEVLVMYRGEIVEQGPVLDIFANPQHVWCNLHP